MSVTNDELIRAFNDLFMSSFRRTLLPARLGRRTGTSTYEVEVPDRVGYYYISTGATGELGTAIAQDKTSGIDPTQTWQRLGVRREGRQLVIREAEYYASGGGGGVDTLDELTDVDTTGVADGDILSYNASLGTWVPFTPTGTTGDAPSPHALDSVHHSGTLADEQAPQFLKTDGSRELTGNLTVAAGITIDGVNISLHASDPDAHHDHVTLGNVGLSIVGQQLSLNLATDPGLEFSGGVRIKLPADSALLRDSTGLHVDPAIAGTGLDWTAGVLSIDPGDGLELNVPGSEVRVNQAFAFTWTGIHTFENDAIFNDPIQVNDVSTFNALPTINANLKFGGSARSITSDNNLTLSPTGELRLDPSSHVKFPDAQEIRSDTVTDQTTGIDGLRFWQPSSSTLWQLNINTIKADQLFVRTFTVDEVRLARGEERWSKSFGIVNENFNLPAVGSNVNVWFDDAPDLGEFPLFKAGDWILIRTFNMSVGFTAIACWMLVIDGDAGGTNDWIQHESDTANRIYRQQWTLQRKSGGTTGLLVRKGVVVLDAGQVGTGWIELNALTEQDGSGGPYIQMGTMTSISGGTEPVHTNRIRIGNLNGAAGYSTPTYGMAAGNNLGLSATGGSFSGFTIEETNGLRLYNTEINLYQGAIQVVALNKNDGLKLQQDDGFSNNLFTGIHWFEDVAAETGASTHITSYVDVGGLTAVMWADSGDSSPTAVSIQALSTGGADAFLTLNTNVGVTLSHGALAFIRLVNSTESIETKGHLYPQIDLTYDLGKPEQKWRAIYVDELHAGVITGEALSGSEWQSPSNMTIDANSSTNTTVFVVNEGTGRADLSVDRNIIVGGTVDGIDIAAFKADYDTHLGNPSAHHNPVTVTGGGISITSPGQVLSITLATNSGLVKASGLGVDSTLAGNGLVLTSGVINIVPEGAGGLEVTSDEIHIKLGNSGNSGLQTDTTGLWLKRRGNHGLNSGISMVSADGVYLADTVANDGLEWTYVVDATERRLRIQLPSNSGLVRDATGLYVNPAIAGQGLQWASGVILPVLGSGLEIDTTPNPDAIRIKLPLSSGLVRDTTGLYVNPGLGIEIASNAVKILLGSNSGLDISAGLVIADSLAGNGLTMSASKQINVNTGNGLEVVSDLLRIKLPASSGLISDGTGLYVNDSLAGSGLSMNASKQIDINAGNGLQVVTDSLRVKPGTNPSGVSGLVVDSTGVWIKRKGDTGAASGISMTSTDGLFLAVALAGNGLQWDATDVILHVGAGNGISVAPNTVAVDQTFSFTWTGTHLWSSGTAQFNTVTKFNQNINFIGSARSIISDATLTLSPTGNLRLDPSADIALPNAQQIRTDTVTDLATEIRGLRFWQPTTEMWQMNISKVKVDELYARTFTIDEVRLARGEEYWSKSYGIVQEDFNLPALASNVDVWFEDAPDLGAAPLFEDGDWLLIRTINMAVSLAVVAVWFTVVGVDVTNGWISHESDAANQVFRQQWRLKRQTGGATNLLIRKGVPVLDAGQVGTAWIYLNALTEDDGSGGPYIEMGRMFSASAGTVPEHKGRIRIGNLNGAAGYSTTTYGMAAGNDLSLDPAAGAFSGFTLTDTEGLRLYNTDFHFYEGSNLIGKLEADGGLIFEYDSASPYTDMTRGIYWLTDLASPSGTSSSGIEAYRDSNGTHLNITALSSTQHAEISINASQSTTGKFSYVQHTDTWWQLQFSNNYRFRFEENGRALIGGIFLPFTEIASTLHVYESTTSTGATTGLTIEQSSTGDAVAQFLLTGGQRWIAGIDNSDSDKFKISRGSALGANDVFTLTTGDAATLAGSLAIGGALTGVTTLTMGGALSGVTTLSMSGALTGVTTITMAGALSGVDSIAARSSSGLGIYDDGSNLGVFVKDGGNVGIGTNNPTQPLDIAGTAIVRNGSILLARDDATNATIQSRTNAAAQISYLQAVAADSSAGSALADLRFQAYGSSVAGTRGGVAFASAGEFVAVTASSFIISAVQNVPIHFTTNNAHRGQFDASGLTLDLRLNAPVLRATASAGLFLQDDGGTTALAVMDGGNSVLVGAETYVQPYSTFDSQNNKAIIVRQATATSAGSPAPSIVFSNNQTDTTQGVIASFHFMNEQNSNSDKRLVQFLARTDISVDTGELLLRTFSAGSPVDAMILKSSGWIGINTIFPGVDVISTADYSASNTLVHLDGATPRLLVRGSTDAAIDLIDTGSGANLKMVRLLNSAGYAKFQAMSDALAVQLDDLINIDLSTGYVGIGDSAPAAVLTVNQTDASSSFPTFRAASNASNVVPIVQLHYGQAAALSGNAIGYFGVQARHNTGLPTNTFFSARISFSATENHTATARGTSMAFSTVPNGSITLTTALSIGQDQLLVALPTYTATVSVVPNMSIDNTGKITRTTHANSSARYKEKIHNIPEDRYSDLLENVTPVFYNLKKEYGGDGRTLAGLLAEELNEAGYREFIQYDEEGRPDLILYDRLIVALILELRNLKRKVYEH